MLTTSFPCPHCGTAFGLSPDYVAQYGGHTTTCTNCQRPFTLPTAAAAQALPAAPPAQGPATVLSYGRPGLPTSPVAQGVWQQGGQIVAVKGAVLPLRCVRCNGQPDGPPKRRKYYWHPPWVYITILAGVLIYAILAMVIQQTGTLDVSLCREHKQRRMWNILAGWLTFLAGIGCFVVAGAMEEGWFALPGVLMFFGGLVWVVLAMRILVPTTIDTHYMWMKGASPDFVAQLPPAPQLSYGYGGYGQFGPPPGAYGAPGGYPTYGNYGAAYPTQGQVPPQQFGPR